MTDGLEPIFHPATSTLELVDVLRALADPTRLEIARLLWAKAGGEIACGGFGLDASKQNLSHHLRVLREAGVIRSRDEGRNRFTSLRREDLDRRFPGLLAAILKERAGSATSVTR